MIHNYTPEPNRQSDKWLLPAYSRTNFPKRPKTQHSVAKDLTSIFWDSHGFILINYLERVDRFDVDSYIGVGCVFNFKIGMFPVAY